MPLTGNPQQNPPTSSPSGEDRSASRNADRWGLAILSGLILLFFSPLLFMDQIIFYYDFTFITYPMRYLVHAMYLDGAWPFWNPHIKNGEPLLAGFIPAVLYPPNVLLLLPDFPQAINMFYVFHFFLLGLPLFMLVRLWQGSVEAALAGALTAVFSGFFLFTVLVNNYFLANCWFPFILYAFERFWREGKLRFFLMAVFGLTCLTFAGSPSSSLMTVLLAAAFCWFYPPQPGLPRRVRFRRLLMGGWAVVLCLGLSAPQLIPTYHFLGESQRQEGVGYEEHTAWSLELQQATELFLPRDLNNFLEKTVPDDRVDPEPRGMVQTFYMGLLPVLALLLTVPGKSLSRIVRFWGWVVWVGLFLALGQYNLLYELVYWGFPPVRVLRFPEKYLFLCAIGLSFVGAFVIDALAQRNMRWPLSPRRIMGATAVLLLLTAGSGLWLPFRPLTGQLAIIGAFGAFMLLAVRSTRHGLLGARVLIVLILVDLALHNWQIPPMTHRDFQELKPALMNEIGPEPYRVYSGRLRQRDVPPTVSLGSPNLMVGQIMSIELLRPYTGIRFGLDYPNGLQGIGLETVDPGLWMKVLEASPFERRRLILERSNVRYWVNWDYSLLFINGTIPLITSDRMEKLEHPLPRAFMVGRARLDRPNYLLNTYFDKKFDPLQEVILTEPFTLPPSPDFQGTVESLQYDHNAVTLHTRQSAAGWLVLLDSYFPGWTATVDGQPEPIFRANQFFRAVPLPAGSHTIEFRFVPVGWREGVQVFWLTGFLTLLSAAWIRFRASRGPEPFSKSPSISN